MTIWNKNNLGDTSQPWARQVEKEIDNQKSIFKSAEINNLKRDDQLASSLRQIQSATNTATSAASDAADAALEASTANSNAITALQDASDALNGLISLGSDGSSYDINAGNISGGTITGVTLKTAASGARIELNQNDVKFYDDNGNYSGKIDAQGDGRSATLNIDNGGGITGMYLYNGGAEIYANGPLGINTQQLVSYGYFHATGNAKVDGSLEVGSFNPTSISTGSVSCSSLSSSGGVSGSSLSTGGNMTADGRINSVGTYNATISSAANVYIASNGNMARSTSSRRYKTDIQDIDYGMKALELQPRTWIDKGEYEENGNSAEGLTRIPGFIAEELHEQGFTELVIYNDDGEPEAISYDRMLVAVIPVLKQQQQTIEALTARIEALEADRV